MDDRPKTFSISNTKWISILYVSQTKYTHFFRNNRLSKLEAHTFKGCPKLRELSLSFNNLDSLDDLSFKDIGGSLESLEISFGLSMRIFPESALKPLQKLLWLSLDNNEIGEISETSLYNLGELQYLNLEANKLAVIPANLLHKNVHKNLRDVRLSFNRLRLLRMGQFSSLEKLQTIMLTGNRLRDIEMGAFRDLPNLVSLILSHNKITSINRRAFISLPHLQKLELQYNSLNDFSLSVFANCTRHPDSPMFLNLSHNVLRHLLPRLNKVSSECFYHNIFSSDNGARLTPPLVQLLDLSHNFISRIPYQVIAQGTLFNLFTPECNYVLSRPDNYPSVPGSALTLPPLLGYLLQPPGRPGRLQPREALQPPDPSPPPQQDLQHPETRSRQHSDHRSQLEPGGKKGSLYRSSLPNLPQVESLQFGQFAGLTNLRIVDLSSNRLRSLPRDAFQVPSLSTNKLAASGSLFVGSFAGKRNYAG